MIRYTQGNLLEAEAEALVNTVNTVGIMGKGIALMFKEAFPDNTRAYTEACKRKEIQLGRMFVTERAALSGPRWIVNFPTKGHWRYPSKLKWISNGLQDLKRVIEEKNIRSIALPPLGSGSGKLDWSDVKPEIERVLGGLDGVEVIVYEPTSEYQNVAKRHGTKKLTVPRALVAELVRRYWILGMECSVLEVQKLAWFLERCTEAQHLPPVLKFGFDANLYGPYADRLRHLLDLLDGSYLRCSRRLADARPTDVIWFDDNQTGRVALYLKTEGKTYLKALEVTSRLISGFESPFGLELLATVDWLLVREHCEPTVPDLKTGLRNWMGGQSDAAQRKLRLFDDRFLSIALARLQAGISSPIQVS